MSTIIEEACDPLTMPAEEVRLTQTFGTPVATEPDKLNVEIHNLNHAMELLEAGAINGFICMSLFGDAASAQYRVSRWSTGGFQAKAINRLGQEGSGCYGLFQDPQARRVIELMHEHAFGDPNGPVPDRLVAKFQPI